MAFTTRALAQLKDVFPVLFCKTDLLERAYTRVRARTLIIYVAELHSNKFVQRIYYVYPPYT